MDAFPPDPEIGTARESMIGSMASIDLPASLPPSIVEVGPDTKADSTYPQDPLHDWLLDKHNIEVPVYAWPHTPTADVPRRRLLRISAQLYNGLDQYERLAEVLSGAR